MLPDDLITAKRILCRNVAMSKKCVLQNLGDLMASSCPPLSANVIFDKLVERERLGNTGLGGGVALPHARIAGLPKAYGALLQLHQSVDYDALDGCLVDLVFCLLVPEESKDDHLQLLTDLGLLFRDKKRCDRIRRATDPHEILQLIENRPVRKSA